MSTTRSLTGWARWVAISAIVGGVCLVGTASAQAAVLPQPLASVTSAVTSHPAPLSSTPLPIASLLGSAPAPTTPLSPPAAPAPAPAAGPAPSSQPAGASSSDRSGTSSSGSSSTAPSSSRQSSAAPARVAASTPVASLCLIPTGSMSPAVEVNLTAVGHDLSSPLVKQFPQVFAPCPTDTVPAGDNIAAVDASLTTLVGACVRVTRQVVPVQTTIVVLDHNLIQQLESAGVPLEQLLVPCPAGAAGSTGGGTSGGSGVATAAQQAGDVAAALTGSPSGRLAFTGATVVPLALLAGVLLWAGSLLVRFSRSLTVAPRRPRS